MVACSTPYLSRARVRAAFFAAADRSEAERPRALALACFESDSCDAAR
jgi:hypothetical protein